MLRALQFLLERSPLRADRQDRGVSRPEGLPDIGPDNAVNASAFDTATEPRPRQTPDAAIVIGSDIPMLTADHVLEAADTLRSSGGVVLGPADDGGYYLIGMTRAHAGLFEDIEWGTGSVLTDTLQAASRIGVDAQLIRGAYDVDTIDDLRRVERDLATAPSSICPELRRWLSES
jgi:glycosyltransferase A (GT-A) superfamily protein (DUF2064 family)